MKSYLLILLGAAAPPSCEPAPMVEDTADTLDLQGIGADCMDGVAILPPETWAVDAVAVGVRNLGGNDYAPVSAPIPWEQVGEQVFARCPDDNVTAWSHFTVFYYPIEE